MLRIELVLHEGDQDTPHLGMVLAQAKHKGHTVTLIVDGFEYEVELKQVTLS